MRKIEISQLPNLGLRNIKTALSIALCVLLYYVIERDGALLATIAALICMQDSVEKSVREGANRMIGTVLGAFESNVAVWLGLIFLGIVIFIYLCNLFKIRDSIIIGCVVFLIIVLEAETKMSPLLYSIHRVLDTFIGIIIAVMVNYFLFRPKPERVALEANLADMEYRIIKAGKQKVADWSGGTTTELFIYPEDCLYGDREFEWRISTSKVLLRSSNFTQLSGYMRRIMVLEGKMSLYHHDNHRITLDAFDQDYFDGQWTTKSFGRCTDFNLMLQKGQEGYLSSISQGESRKFDSTHFTAFYILSDQIVLTIGSETETLVVEDLGKHDFILFYPLLENNDISPDLTVHFENKKGTVGEVVAVETVIFPSQ